MNRNGIDETSVLQMALVGFRIQREEIDANITEIEARLGGTGSRSGAPAEPGPASNGRRKKRVFSEATKRKMARAQKRIWALRKAEKTQAKRVKRPPKTSQRAAAAPARKRKAPANKSAKPTARATAKKATKSTARATAKKPRTVPKKAAKPTAKKTVDIPAPTEPSVQVLETVEVKTDAATE